MRLVRRRTRRRTREMRMSERYGRIKGVERRGEERLCEVLGDEGPREEGGERLVRDAWQGFKFALR